MLGPVIGRKSARERGAGRRIGKRQCRRHELSSSACHGWSRQRRRHRHRRTLTLYGCLGSWNTTAVPDGTYTLRSVSARRGGQHRLEYGDHGEGRQHRAVDAMLVPANGASVRGNVVVLGRGRRADNVAVTRVEFRASRAASLSNTSDRHRRPARSYGWISSGTPTRSRRARTRSRASRSTRRATARRARPSRSGSTGLPRRRRSSSRRRTVRTLGGTALPALGGRQRRGDEGRVPGDRYRAGAPSRTARGHRDVHPIGWIGTWNTSTVPSGPYQFTKRRLRRGR